MTYTPRQVSQQQAIYDQITNLTVRGLRLVFSLALMIGPTIKSSFNTVLRLNEVMQISEPIVIFVDPWTEIHPVE